jgi:hypothetical protein
MIVQKNQTLLVLNAKRADGDRDINNSKETTTSVGGYDPETTAKRFDDLAKQRSVSF